MTKNLFNDEIIKRYIFYRPIKKYKQYECTMCMEWYDTLKNAKNCCTDKKIKWLAHLQKGKHKKYPKSSIGMMCLTCKSYFLGNCKCDYGSFMDDCDICY